MTDPRIKQLAHNLIHFSLKLQKGEKVWISASNTGTPVLEALVEETYGVGAYPFIQMEDQRVNAALMAGMTPEPVSYTHLPWVVK